MIQLMKKREAKLLETSQAESNSLEFESQFKEYWAYVYRILKKLVGDPAEAEDLALETFLRLYQRSPIKDDGFQLGGWLYRVATNLGLRSIRSFKRRERYEIEAGRFALEEAPETRPAELHAQAEEQDLARRALAKMNERRSQLLILRYSGLSYKEIADILWAFTHVHWTAAGESRTRIRSVLSGACPGGSMKEHLTDGKLRASLDGELDESLLRHLDACAECRGHLNQLKQSHLRVASWLSFLAPGSEPVPSVQFAWSRFTEQYLKQKEISMLRKCFAFPVVRAAAIAVLAFALLMTIPTTRALAGELLNLFRVQQVAVMPIELHRAGEHDRQRSPRQSVERIGLGFPLW